MRKEERYYIGRNDFSSGYPSEIDPRFSIPRNIHPLPPEESEAITLFFKVGPDEKTVIEKREITKNHPMTTVFEKP